MCPPGTRSRLEVKVRLQNGLVRATRPPRLATRRPERQRLDLTFDKRAQVRLSFLPVVSQKPKMKSLSAIILFCGTGFFCSHAASFQFTEIRKETNGISIKWEAETGRNYQIETAASVLGPWQARASLTAASTLLTWVDVEATSLPQQFYRVAVVPNASGDLSREGLFAGDFIPKNATLSGEQSGEIAANAAFLASQLGAGGARLITTGTLTQQGLNWSYAASPNDRLVVRFATGTNVSLYITRMQGDFSLDAPSFLRKNHNFDYRVVVPSVSDLTVTSEIGSGNPTLRATALGTLVWSNVTYSINLALVGEYRFEIDKSGSSFLNDYTMTGTVSAPGYSLTISERRRFELVSAETGTATSEETWNNNTLILGADAYKWVNARKQKSFKNGKPSSLDTYWQASGGVLKNGAPFGLYKFDTGTVLGYVRFNLVLPNEVIELESWNVQI